MSIIIFLLVYLVVGIATSAVLFKYLNIAVDGDNPNDFGPCFFATIFWWVIWIFGFIYFFMKVIGYSIQQLMRLIPDLSRFRKDKS